MKEEFNTKFYFYARVNGACSIYPLDEFCELNITLCQAQLPGNLVTVCIIADDKGNTARGISALSINDSFVLEVGMYDAECKALRAIKGRKLEKEYSDKRAIRTLVGVRCPYTLPAEKNPKLSLFERRILFGKKFMEKKEVNWSAILNCAKTIHGIRNDGYLLYIPIGKDKYGIGIVNRDIKCGETIFKNDLVVRTT